MTKARVRPPDETAAQLRELEGKIADLTRDLNESREQQAATSEILGVISA